MTGTVRRRSAAPATSRSFVDLVIEKAREGWKHAKKGGKERRPAGRLLRGCGSRTPRRHGVGLSQALVPYKSPEFWKVMKPPGNCLSFYCCT